MNKDPSANIIIPSLPEEIKGLSEIALNLWWTWNPRGENLFRILNPYLWKESENNPIAVLKNLPKEYLESLTKDENFMKEYKYVYALACNSFSFYSTLIKTFSQNEKGG